MTALPEVRVLRETEIRALIGPKEALGAVREGFSRLARGQVTLPGVIGLDLPEAQGEVHVKGAHIHGSPSFSIKEAAGFYGNTARGLPVSSGVVLVFDAATGFLGALLLDNGYLTELRTGAAGAINKKTRLIYLANPNNPTGTWFSSAAFIDFMDRVPATVLVIVDEAYLEFVTAPELQSALTLVNQYDNLIVARTFSKAYGLAGLRVGYIAAHADCVAVMERVRESFNVNLLGLAACEAALNDEAHLQWVIEKNDSERAWLIAQFERRGLKCGPSQTNFILVDFQKDSIDIEAQCVAKAVVLRPMRGYGLPNCLRITVGNRDENRQLLKILDEVLA